MGRLALFSLAACALAGVVIAQAQPQGAAAVSGAPAPSSATPAVADTASTSDPVICEWEEETGSLLGRHKLCLTRSQWQQTQFDSQDMINDHTRRSYQAGTVGH